MINALKINLPACMYSLGDKVLVTLKDEQINEFSGRVTGFKQGKYVQVTDQENDIWDCELSEVQPLEE